jgi:pyridoxal phosphate enzyme (YggS family)
MSQVGKLLSYSAVGERLKVVQSRLAAAAQRANRAPNDITLIAISKTHPAAAIRSLVQLGVTDVGENRVQEAESKIYDVGRQSARWHLVGHLQANKARKAVKLFDLIHSLDSVELAERLNRLCTEQGRDKLQVMIQVELGGEITKSGIKESEVATLARTTAALERLELIGLMTLPPFFDEPEAARPYFAKLRELRDKLAGEGLFGNRAGELSMGMTNDLETAIEEGATMVRVGTAIFGERT